MRFFTTVHILLLTYVIAALLFWGISLQKQNRRSLEMQKIILRTDIDSTKHPALYHQRLGEITDRAELKKKQYIGEGVTFFVVILIGASVVYSSFKRSLRITRQQNNFMLSVTHELKSPIAGIKLNLQTMERHKLDDEKKKTLLERSIKEANRLNDLCTNILLASQMDGKQYKAAQETLNFSDLVEDCVEDYALRYPQRFEEDIENDCYLRGDKLMLQMAINNLLENAVKYTPADKPITITLDKKEKCIVLQVADEGQGISDEEKSKIFNKFYRVGNEISRTSKGTGLGLYLTSKIIRQHKGKLSVRNNMPCGSIFEMSIPVA
ncbi:MAG: HAMP domain-containing histidine kinase [Flavipsychrobacter sp.]|nr:HAMP domain-containing histidine kinase [Flavipsychrobacter sp.]